MKNDSVVYIGGYGRSGSTLLERILASNYRLFALGELARLPIILAENSWTCSCGEDLQDCEFWSNFMNNSSVNNKSLERWLRLQHQNESFSGLWKKFFSRRKSKEYQELIEVIFKEFFNLLPDSVDYVIDSSKTARKSFFRPLEISCNTDLNVKLIHLVRDGRGCMWSNLKGSNRKMERGEPPNLPFAALRTVISWPLANTAPHLFAWLVGGENYLQVRYEDFVNEPSNSLHRIGEYLNVDLTPQIEMLEKQEAVPVSHQLAGNRIRKEESIVLKEDTDWRRNLKFWHHLLYWLGDWPWALKYGYGPK